MGCNSSAVVPLGESDLADGAGIKVRLNPSTPETVALSPVKEKFNGCFPRRSNTHPLESAEPPAETLLTDFNKSKEIGTKRGIPPPPPLPPPPTAFEVPVNEESLIKKHPPKRLKKLEEQQSDNSKVLTKEFINNKQQEAENRRKEILNQRVISAQQKFLQLKKLTHSNSLN